MEGTVTREDSEPALRSGGLGFLFLLTFLNVLNFIDRQLLSSFASVERSGQFTDLPAAWPDETDLDVGIPVLRC